MKNKLLRRITVILTVFFLTEIILTIYSFYTDRTLSRANKILHREKIKQEAFSTSLLIGKGRKFENSLDIHPFFGYVYNSKLKGINNFGFKTKYNIGICDSEYCLESIDQEKSLVIGIFGGSFAEQTGELSKYLESKFSLLNFPKRVVILNFGIGGYAIPQSAFIFIYFRELFDIVIFIDGVNEVWNPLKNNGVGYPPEFAKAYHFKHKLSLSKMSPVVFASTYNIIKLKKQLYGITRFSLKPFIRQSLFGHYAWKGIEGNFRNRINKERWKIINEYDIAPNFFDISDETLLRFSAKRWKGYHRLIHQVSSSMGILDIHILQPNPYIPDSKDFTSEEIKAIKGFLALGDCVLMGYPKLQEALSGLKREGVITEDLSAIFRNETKTVWIDGGHLNQEGYKIVLDKVFDLIQENIKILE